MKKLLLILLCVPLIFSCGDNNNEKGEDVQTLNITNKKSIDNMIEVTESNIVVSVINYRDEESNLGMLTSPNEWELLQKESNKYKDSILLPYDDYISSGTLREDLSKKYFNVDEILKVYIYDYNSDMICIASYVKTVMSFCDMNGEEYYHVFNPDKIIKHTTNMESPYFISNSAPKNNNIVIKEHNDTDLDNILIRDYIRRGDQYEISHYELRDGDHKTIYSIVAICDHDNNFFKSYIIETKGKESNILHTVSDCIWGALPTKVFINNKPVFVGESGSWEIYSDTWIFDPRS